MHEHPKKLHPFRAGAVEKLFSTDEVRENAFEIVVFLASTGKAFSEGFFYYLFDNVIPTAQKAQFRTCWDSFNLHYIAKEGNKTGGRDKVVAGRQFLRLASPHFARTIEALPVPAETAPQTSGAYIHTRSLLREKWQRRAGYAKRIENSLHDKLMTGVLDVGDALLFADLAQFGKEPAKNAVDLWWLDQINVQLDKLPERGAVAIEFYEAIADYGFDAIEQEDVHGAQEWFKKAFEIFPDTKDMMYYATFLRDVALPQAKSPDESKNWIAEIASLYTRLLEKNSKDIRALTAGLRQSSPSDTKQSQVNRCWLFCEEWVSLGA